jgi:hypothetical protein
MAKSQRFPDSLARGIQQPQQHTVALRISHASTRMDTSSSDSTVGLHDGSRRRRSLRRGRDPQRRVRDVLNT